MELTNREKLKKVMAQNLQFYMLEKSVTRRGVSKALNLSYSTYNDWCNGTSYPRIDKIEMLAQYFGVNKGDLIEDRIKSLSYTDLELKSLVDRWEADVIFRRFIEDLLKLEEDEFEVVVQVTSKIANRE